MNKPVIIDSSLLIEYIKGRKSKLLLNLMNDEEHECFINETIASEYLFYWLGINGGKSPLSVQSSRAIRDLITNNQSFQLLESFSFCSNNAQIYSLVPQFMSAYNLLPNDAIILATCKIHSITKLASHDTDFILPCKKEGIEFLTETE